MNTTSISVENLLVTKGKKKILRGLNFEVKKGCLTGLIGPSGSGKTTLMRAIVGMQAISSGSLLVSGKNAGSKKLRGGIGYVTQEPAVYDDLTVQQNLSYFATLINANKRDIDTVIKQVDLGPQRKQLASTLSGGQRARVSLAIALLGEPDILVLDEPTVGLDPVLRHQLWKLFQQFADNGRTILVSSHVMDEADRCDDVLLLRDGELLWADSRKALLKSSSTDSTESAFLKLVGGR